MPFLLFLLLINVEIPRLSLVKIGGDIDRFELDALACQWADTGEWKDLSERNALTWLGTRRFASSSFMLKKGLFRCSAMTAARSSEDKVSFTSLWWDKRYQSQM